MADPGMTPGESAGLAAVISGAVVAFKEMTMWIVKAIRGNTKAQIEKAKLEEQARAEDREREIAHQSETRLLNALNDLGFKLDRQGQKQQENREMLVKLQAEQTSMSTWLKNLTEDMRVIKRRGTGKHDK